MREEIAVGRAIRATRRGRMSLRELAARAETSVGSLSRIENGLGNPSLALILRVADALGTSHLDLLAPLETAATRIVRAADRPHARAIGDRYDVELLTPDLAHGISVASFRIAAGEQRHSDHSYVGEVCLLVRSGRLMFEIVDGDEVDLGPGDSITYALPTRFGWRTAGPEPADVLTVFCPRDD
jgi:transcriptional regulator with XRE-family HTH domain